MDNTVKKPALFDDTFRDCLANATIIASMRIGERYCQLGGNDSISDAGCWTETVFRNCWQHLVRCYTSTRAYARRRDIEEAVKSGFPTESVTVKNGTVIEVRLGGVTLTVTPWNGGSQIDTGQGSNKTVPCVYEALEHEHQRIDGVLDILPDLLRAFDDAVVRSRDGVRTNVEASMEYGMKRLRAYSIARTSIDAAVAEMGVPCEVEYDPVLKQFSLVFTPEGREEVAFDEIDVEDVGRFVRKLPEMYEARLEGRECLAYDD